MLSYEANKVLSGLKLTSSISIRSVDKNFLFFSNKFNLLNSFGGYKLKSDPSLGLSVISFSSIC